MEDDNIKALLRRCAGSLLSAVSRIGNGNETSGTNSGEPTEVNGSSRNSPVVVRLEDSTTSQNSTSLTRATGTIPRTVYPIPSAIEEHRQLFNFQPSTGRTGRTGRSPYLNSRTGSDRKRRKVGIDTRPQWSHVFVCLSSTDWQHVPSFAEKAELALSGLGEKKISFPANENFDASINREFPSLREGGGYQVLRSNAKILQSLPTPKGGYSVEYLKGVLAQAKGYIRPLQKDLTLMKQEVDIQL